MQALNRDWEKLSNKSSSNHIEIINGVDQIISHLELLKDLINRDDYQVIANGLDPILNQSKSISKSALLSHKEFHSIYSKWQKSIDKKFNQSILPLIGSSSNNNQPSTSNPSLTTTSEPPSSFSRSKHLPFGSDSSKQALKRVITSHLLRQGRFETAKIFAEESGVSISRSELESCQELYRITNLIRIGQLGEALAWAKRNREWLEARESSLEFDLRRSAFVRILTQPDFRDSSAPENENREEGMGGDVVMENIRVGEEEDEVGGAMEIEEEEDDDENRMMIESITFNKPSSENQLLTTPTTITSAAAAASARTRTISGESKISSSLNKPILSQPHAEAGQRALEYARYHFPRFFPKRWEESVKLTASVLFTPLSKLKKSPYSEYFRPPPGESGENGEGDDDVQEGEWGNVGQQPWVHAHHLVPLFTKEFYARMEWSKELPLKVATDLGSGGALAKIAKVRSVMKEKRTEWSQSDELPVEIPLPPDYRFHSVFACPVSKEQSTESNPPMMMPCGHVIAKESMQKLAKGGGTVKCHYCPSSASMNSAIQVYF